MLSLVIAFAMLAAEQNTAGPLLDQQFQSALSQYRGGEFASAAAQLETLVTRVPNSYEVHELLGLVYAAEALPARATTELERAVQLKPNEAAARTNLAAALMKSGQPALALPQLRKAVALEPQEFDANHNLGEFYIQRGKLADAIPLLQHAQSIQPENYDNGYDLAMAYFLNGNPNQGKETATALLARKNTGELHNLIGQIEEKEGNYLPAAKEFETAAHLDPTEDNLFDWGSEFLLHRTYDPAVSIFEEGTHRYPKSPRLFMGLGMALSARGNYDQAITALLQAIDMAPEDPRGYRFLAHAYEVSANPSDAVVQRFRRYAELAPKRAMAQYYLAMSLMKGNRPEPGSPLFTQIDSLLKHAIALDPSVAEFHLQLGNWYADQHDSANAFLQYERSIKLDPDLTDAHYRLGQYYVRAGRKDLAQHELEIYQRLRAKYLADRDREGNEVQQFILAAKSTQANRP